MTNIVDIAAMLERAPPAFTDEALALRFADAHAERLRYVALWNKWYVWSGTHWRQDDTLLALSEARKLCRAAAADCNKGKQRAAIASAKTIAAMLSLARADRRLAATVDQWDSDPWLLGTPTGTVNVRTGEQRPHSPSDYVTKLTAVAPGGACPIFRRFLAEVTDGDPQLQGFLQRVVGYALTGSTREHSMFFLHGLGANGKSVFVSTVAGILGDYHATAPIETFTASNADRHPCDLAALRGARLVTATETEEGRRWAEARIKTLTGGDKISARFMRQDFFDYTPAFKLMTSGNHKPGLRSVDEAIRRRLHLIPFTVTIPAAQRDPELGEKLKAEWPGILQWAIEGCAEWQEFGLAPPAAVRDATAVYLESEDAIAAWIEDCCDRDANAWAKRGDLFASWKLWTEGAGEHCGAAKRFYQNLEARDFTPHRQRTGERGFLGLKIRR